MKTVLAAYAGDWAYLTTPQAFSTTLETECLESGETMEFRSVLSITLARPEFMAWVSEPSKPSMG